MKEVGAQKIVKKLTKKQMEAGKFFAAKLAREGILVFAIYVNGEVLSVDVVNEAEARTFPKIFMGFRVKRHIDPSLW